MNLPIAAADIFTLIKVAIVILIIVVPIVGQLFAKIRDVQQQQQAARPPRRAGGNVQGEIEEFLRRAAERRAPPQGRPQPGPPPVPPVLTAEPADDDEPVGARVVEHVEQYLDSGEFARRTAQLGEEVAAADDQFEQHAQQVFGHEVSRLAKKRGATAAPPALTDEALLGAQDVPSAEGPGGLAGFLASPEGMRQAIIMNEILRRPEWE